VLLRAYGLHSTSATRYRLAFVIPPALGGANDFANLWPLPLPHSSGATTAYDRVVTTTAKAVCAGRTGLQAAQFAVGYSWPTALHVLRLG
jgi:hypothetical protein